MARPRLKQVAEMAQVSEPTVSRVINGRSGVATATRQRVLDALNDLGYGDLPEPVTTRRGVVGIVCGDLLNPVFPTLLNHVSAELSSSGILTTVAVTNRLSTEQRCIEELAAAAVDGMIFIGGHHAETQGDWSHYRRLAEAGVPMVFVNGIATDIDVPHVRCDEEAGAGKAISHLINLGHRRIGCVLGTTKFIPTTRFVHGYKQVLVDKGIKVGNDTVVNTAFTLEGGRAGALRLLDRGVTGILAGNDLMALGAVQAAGAKGLNVPGQVSVVGYDGTDMTALTDPGLTTLRQPFEDMAKIIASAINAEIDGSTSYRDHYVFQPELIVRGSSGPIAQG